jgi:hypothetical protein
MDIGQEVCGVPPMETERWDDQARWTWTWDGWEDSDVFATGYMRIYAMSAIGRCQGA